MPIFRNFESDPTVPLLQAIRNEINNLGASFASSLGGLGNLDFNFPTFTYSRLETVELVENFPTLIMERENKARRNTVKNSKTSTGVIFLIQGQDEPAPEDFSKTPWVLQPGEMRIDDRDGGYPIWAMAVGGNATIEVAIEYAENPDTQIISMNIGTFFGTGQNWESSEDWYINNRNESVEPKFNSTVTGWKMFKFDSFQPGQQYTFNMNSGGLNYKNGVAHPINVYLFDVSSSLKGGAFLVLNPLISFSFTERPYGISTLRETLSILKRNSWAARLTSAGGQFTLAPKSGSFVGLIDVKLEGATYADTAVFNYEAGEPGTFTLMGV